MTLALVPNRQWPYAAGLVGDQRPSLTLTDTQIVSVISAFLDPVLSLREDDLHNIVNASRALLEVAGSQDTLRMDYLESIALGLRVHIDAVLATPTPIPPEKSTQLIDVGDWDDLVVETYGRPYYGTEHITVPGTNEDYYNDMLPEEINGDVNWW